MKQDLHPRYEPVVFRDKGADRMYLTRSTATSGETVTWRDGRTYPVIDVPISAASHPYWTGGRRALDQEGRVARFHRRYGRASRP